MKVSAAILTMCLLACLSTYAQTTFKARVIDAQTNEPLPFVNVYVSENLGTITNNDGEFSIPCDSDATLQISYIGYEHTRHLARNLPETIRMKPMATVMQEVNIEGLDNVLRKIYEQLMKENKKHDRDLSKYFFRLSAMYPNVLELAEGFLTARSEVNLRAMGLVSAQRGHVLDGAMTSPDLKGLSNTNLNVFMTLAPMVFPDPVETFWETTITPLGVAEQGISNYYHVKRELLQGDDGQQIYKICTHYAQTDTTTHVLEGILYIDKKTEKLLSFDGELKNVKLRYYDAGRNQERLGNMQVNLHIDYRHMRKFTEVATLTGIVRFGQIEGRLLLFNVEDKNLKQRDAVSFTQDNFIQRIDEVGMDSVLWEKSDIVQRTRHEEQVQFLHQTLYDPSKRQKKFESVNPILDKAMKRLTGETMTLKRKLKQ